MGKGLPRSLSRGEPLSQEIIKAIVKVRAVAMTVDGLAGVGDGQVVIGDFPEGNVLFLGAVAYMAFSGPGADANLGDTWQGDFSIGTTADSGDDLTGTDADIIGSTALAAATAEVSPRTRGTGVTQAILDNTDGSLELNLNLLVDDADIGADGIAFTVEGELHILYSMLGND